MASPRVEAGTYAAGESCVVFRPRKAEDVDHYGVLYCHGATASARSIMRRPGQRGLLTRLCELGFPVLLCDLGAPPYANWGNSEHMTRIGQAVSYAFSIGFRPGKLHFIGASMGNVGQLKYAVANPSIVASITGILPAYDMERYRDVDVGPGLRASIDTAWGVTYPEQLPPAASPKGNIDSLLDVVPWRSYCSNYDDPTFVEDALELASLFGTQPFDLGPHGHGDSAIGNVDAAELAEALSLAERRSGRRPSYA